MINIVLFFGFVIFAFYLLFRYKKKINYYKNIIDTSHNIILIYKNDNMVDVNKMFFKYFESFNSLNSFKKNYKGICDFFVSEKGYIGDKYNDENWYKYLLENKNIDNKVKIKIDKKEYYFSVNVSKLGDKKNHISVILSDITAEENYKIMLQKNSAADIFLDLGNSKFFESKLKDEIARANRYSSPLSLIMLHIKLSSNVNNKYKNSISEKVYLEYTDLISSVLREYDTVYRLEKDKLIIILPYVNKVFVQTIAQKIKLKAEFYKKLIPATISYKTIQYSEGEKAKDVFDRLKEGSF